MILFTFFVIADNSVYVNVNYNDKNVYGVNESNATIFYQAGNQVLDNADVLNVNKKRLIKDIVTIVVQVNGKIRGTFEAPFNAPKEEILKEALLLPKVKEYVDGKNMAKTIHIMNKLLNIVV